MSNVRATGRGKNYDFSDGVLGMAKNTCSLRRGHTKSGSNRSTGLQNSQRKNQDVNTRQSLLIVGFKATKADLDYWLLDHLSF